MDPRSSGDLRAGDADRETARQALGEAYADGQLSHDEYSQRLDLTLNAHHLGQLVPLLHDLSIRGPQDRRRLPDPGHRRQGDVQARPHWSQGGLARTALFVVGVTNLVWAVTSLTSGTLIYYWPIWPALGMVIAILAAIVFGKDDDRHRELE